jgi:hypothetical protein
MVAPTLYDDRNDHNTLPFPLASRSISPIETLVTGGAGAWIGTRADSRASSTAGSSTQVVVVDGSTLSGERTRWSDGWRCYPAARLTRARPVNLKDHSEQADRLLHWEHG